MGNWHCQLLRSVGKLCEQSKGVEGVESRGGGVRGVESTVNTLAELLVDINILPLIIGRLQQESLHSPDLIMPLN